MSWKAEIEEQRFNYPSYFEELEAGQNASTPTPDPGQWTKLFEAISIFMLIILFSILVYIIYIFSN